METKKLHIGEKVRAHMEASGMNVAALARQLGTSPRNVRYMFDRQRLSLPVLRHLSVILGKDLLLHYLMPESRALYLQARENDVPALLESNELMQKTLEKERKASDVQRAEYEARAGELQSRIDRYEAELAELRIRYASLEQLNAELKEVITSLSGKA